MTNQIPDSITVVGPRSTTNDLPCWDDFVFTWLAMQNGAIQTPATGERQVSDAISETPADTPNERFAKLVEKFKAVETLDDLREVIEEIRQTYGEDAVKELRISLDGNGNLKGFEFVIDFGDGHTMAGSDSVTGDTFGYEAGTTGQSFDSLFDIIPFGESTWDGNASYPVAPPADTVAPPPSDHGDVPPVDPNDSTPFWDWPMN